ncbi:polysaccharide biosynthesis tyrosine autokinase [Mycobacterium sp. URHB0044]|uniref:polysaccharide biosynthesis tyrosine autokinase n=1 Tax=Mycobacterium sp. URHB0044 TaxID=1380386 RepID=UPI0009DD62ED|nr:polysaccharide biosynthesis tyrosine autokinase [Mycobacterium sp. URHB0044]
MSLREYLQLMRYGKWWIAAGLLFGMLGGLAFALTSVPTYVATTTLYFAAIEGGGEPGQAYQGALLAEQKARAYTQLIVSDRVLNEVRNDTTGACRDGCGPVPANSITVEASAGNPTVIVKVTDSSAKRAAMVADSLAEKTSNLVADLERPRDPTLSTVTTLRVLAPADIPTTPTSPNLEVDVLVGAVIGGFLGLSVALIRRNLDRSVRTKDALEELTDLNVLGSVPYDKQSRRTPSLLPDRPHGQVAEAVRQLRVNLRSAGIGDNCTSLLVTSAVAGEGKTSLACNLAAAFAMEGDKVLVVDANLRRPSIGNFLGITKTIGLSTVLLGQCQPSDAIGSWRDGLFDVLTSGPSPENPSELLGSDRASAMLAEFESHYDIVLIDSPALPQVADGIVLARACDATLLVVRYGRTPAAEVTEALEALRAVSARVLGCVFSMEPRPKRTRRSRASAAESFTRRPKPSQVPESVDPQIDKDLPELDAVPENLNHSGDSTVFNSSEARL